MSKAEYRSAVRSRKLIKKALADLLQEKPLDKITVTDIVNRAEINRGTFYAHYADISDVIQHLIHHTFSNIQEALSSPAVSITEIPHTLLACIQSILEEDLDFYRKILHSSASTLMTEQLVQITIDYLLKQEQAFGVQNHDQYVLMIRFCAGGLSNLYYDWFSGTLNYSLDELTHHAESLLMGIITNSAKID